MKIEYTDNIDIKAWLGRWQANNQKALYHCGILVHKDILAESRKPKSGRIYERKLPSGRTVRHTAANQGKGESTARMTGAQNRARGFYVDKKHTIWGVDRSVEYAKKNELEFHDMEQALKRNQNQIVDIFAINISNFLDQ